MNLHPAIVHFPIALLVVAALLAILSLFNKKESIREWMFRNLVFGVVFAPLAIISGIIEEQSLQHNEAIHSVLIIHKYNAFIILVVYAVLTFWFWKRKDTMQSKEYAVWVVCLLLGTGLVAYQGYLGGKMVFDLGAGVKPMEESMKKNHNHESGEEDSSSHDHEQTESSDTTAHDHGPKIKTHQHNPKEVNDTTETQKKKKELKDMKY